MKRIAAAAAVLGLLSSCTGPQAGTGGAGTQAPALLAFALVAPPADGVVDQEAGTVAVSLPAGSRLDNLVASFTFTGSAVTVNGVAQESGMTPNDFQAPVPYVVRAEDGASATYLVSVNVPAVLGSSKELTSFRLASPAVSGVIDAQARTVTVTVPHDTDVGSLVAVFEATGVSVTVDEVEQASGVTANDFSEPLPYLVHAEDGTTASWLVTVTAAPDTHADFVSFSAGVPAVNGLVDTATGIIRVRLPPGSDVSSLAPSFTTTGLQVTVNGVVQESGATVNDFSAPVAYVVTAEDGTTREWSARVTGTLDLVINELDVDQPGTDTAEFVELYSGTGIDLTGISLILVNGGSVPGVEYARVDLGPAGVLAPGTFLVLSGPNVTPAPGAAHLTPTGWELSNRIQNGPSDAAVLFDALGHHVVDTVAYNGALHRAVLAGEPGEVDVTEGAGGAPADSGSTPGSVGRNPSAQDTGQNAADFRFSAPPTPGVPNN